LLIWEGRGGGGTYSTLSYHPLGGRGKRKGTQGERGKGGRFSSQRKEAGNNVKLLGNKKGEKGYDFRSSYKGRERGREKEKDSLHSSTPGKGKRSGHKII